MSDWISMGQKLLDWIIRPSTLALVLIRSGISLLGISVLGNIAVNVFYKSSEIELRVGGETTGGLPDAWLYGVGAFGLLLIALGLVVSWIDRRQVQRKCVFVMEHRGLFPIDTPLASSLPPTIVGRKDELIVDVREGVEDGRLTRPDIALQKVIDSRGDLRRRLEREDPKDVTLVYAGLNAVPLTFLTGVLLDDECHIKVFDWDRKPPGRWKEISNGGDDQKRFEVEQQAMGNQGEAILAVSVSYQVELSAIRETFGELPLTHLKMGELSSDSHWSSEKQAALAMQFFEEIKRLSACGFSRIHLIIAAPNSVVFQLGRVYDRRNLPPAIVHQFERTSSPAYPWGVELPSHGVSVPLIVYRSPTNTASEQQA